jgi:pSer/pThr/pTyr-binding forkhead associated (FHA) protein
VTYDGAAGSAMPDELALEAISGRAAGFSFAVSDRLVIGRNSDGPGRLADDPELSRDHAEITRGSTGEFEIADLASTNGTFVNGSRLNAPAVLRTDDEIEVGATKLRVRWAPAAAGPPIDVDVRATTVIIDVPSGVSESVEHVDPGTEDRPAAAAGQPVRVSLTLDLEHKAVELTLDSPGETIQLVLEDGQWRLGNGGS